MNLAPRALLLAVLAVVLAIAGMWSGEPLLRLVWVLPLGLLIAGLVREALLRHRDPPRVTLNLPGRLYLGRPQQVPLHFVHDGARALWLEYAPAAPAALRPLGGPRRLQLLPGVVIEDALELLPRRLGEHAWPPLPARRLGRFGLAWWSLSLPVSAHCRVAPDTWRVAIRRVLGTTRGLRARRVAGAGSELRQLRAYAPGDPLSRIDWKTTARAGELITREFSEDQHLDVLIALDAGRLSRIGAGELDRLGLFANVAARFAEAAVLRDDRVGLLAWSDAPMVACAPDRGARAVLRLRECLASLVPRSAESDPVATAVAARRLLRHRGLVVLLTDLEDAALHPLLARAVRLLSPPHLALVAGIQSPETATLARRAAQNEHEAWVALAAQEHEARVQRQAALLRRLGAPVVLAPEATIESAVLDAYESLRRRRRI
ncbi:MAG: DUF58 domain-containing protein [Steroidobacteraceae bacterium]|nr:DUF58 domain-containing protein [Nevskiaceae bacterium]MCP5340135.1 DUF58 domain-containing protein [Nevskiaceae bacterium]MCP5467378.1 DUF58 domain-containing protein [Nevskiaceae bacterium]